MAKVMLVDDDASMHALIGRIVNDAGYEFCGAYDGTDGLDVLLEEHPDVLLLDVMLPGMNGYEVCRKMREQGRRIPIIFLSAKGDIVDKSIGFEAGGDDYVVKPFSNEELLLRLGAHVRRHKGDIAASRPVQSDEVIAIGDLSIDFSGYEVLLRGNPVNLTSKEFEILALLAESPGRVYTREQIFGHIWGEEGVIDNNSITVFIRKIREKIEDNPSKPKYLLTVWRVGYKFANRV